MACGKLGAGAVDVRGDDTVEVAPADDETQDDAALVHTLDIVADPGDGVGDAGVDAQGAEEGACVLDMGLLAAEEDGETGDADEGNEDVAETALAGAISDVADGDGQDCCTSIRRNGEKLCLGGRVTHLRDDSGEEQGEGVEWHVATHVDHHAQPHLVILKSGSYILHLKLFMFG